MWGALLVGVFIFGLAYVYNFSGMAASLAKAFASIGTMFIVVAPILGFIGVALSGSNTSTNAMFGKFQALVGQILGFRRTPAADREFGRCRDRQADRTTDRQRRRVDHALRAQRRRSDPSQFRLVSDRLGLSHRDQRGLLPVLPWDHETLIRGLPILWQRSKRGGHSRFAATAAAGADMLLCR